MVLDRGEGEGMEVMCGVRGQDYVEVEEGGCVSKESGRCGSAVCGGGDELGDLQAGGKDSSIFEEKAALRCIVDLSFLRGGSECHF